MTSQDPNYPEGHTYRVYKETFKANIFCVD
jgi:hypothetical protein